MSNSHNCKIFFLVCIVFISLFSFNSCKKSSTSPHSSIKTDTDVYIIGYTSTLRGVFATYWKNGVTHQLTNDSTSQSSANSIFVKDTDIYICGTVNNQATFWKNGIATTIPNFSSANAITVSGNDVYVAGSLSTNGIDAVYWKNGSAITLATSQFNIMEAQSIVVNGNDVYALGLVTQEGIPYYLATLWKNGVQTTIGYTIYPTYTDYTRFIDGSANLAINGTDVYVTGANISKNGFYNHPSYWLNGNLVVLDTVAKGAVNAVAIHNGSAYLAGYTDLDQPCYWQNNTVHALSTNQQLFKQYIATGIIFCGSDMYISGFPVVQNNFKGVVYWKNGNLVQVSTDSKSVATGIAVVTHPAK